MMGDDEQHNDGIAPRDRAADAGARHRAIAIACAAASLRRAYRDGLAMPLPPAIDDLLRKLE
jgi:hypothetical protein